VTEAPALETILELPERIDLRLTLAPLAHGRSDPTFRFAADGIWYARWTDAGAATVHVRATGQRVAVRGWGPGAQVAADAVPDLIGLHDQPRALVAHHRRIGQLAHRFPGLRLPRSGSVLAALIPAVCEQKITGVEARRVYRALVLGLGEPAPGPARLSLPPSAERLAATPYFAFHPFGLERRRAELLRRLGGMGSRLEPGSALDNPDTWRAIGSRLAAIPGIGPWTTAEVLRVAGGDPDAISVGDYHLPNLVAFALAGEPRGTDDRMLELLEPYRGQRGRVQRLLEVSGIRAPRYGPRMVPRNIGAL
jgi:3-methyladenine DNA glycosylase/8-oxoguanine DNA glycosylase